MKKNLFHYLKTIFISGITACFICLLCKSTWAASEIKFKEENFDFGKIIQGEAVTHVFEFENMGDETLTIKNVRAGWGCTAVNLSARDLAPKNKGQIKATLHTSGRRGKLSKTISVETNDPNHSLIKLTILAMVEVELFTDPVTVYFKDMNQGEKRLQKVTLKNTTQKALQISSIDSNDKMIMIELVNHSPEWPIDLKPNDSMDLLVSFRYQLDKPRFSKQIKISYAGGKANEAHFRVYATLKPEAQRPAKQTESIQKNLKPRPEQNTKPTSFEKPPADQAVQEGSTSLPSDSQTKKGINKPEEKGPEKDIFSY